ncbi:MAG: insulinase family protein, partial [Deltaproteobacteria bacterium]|nr:insulinase family protein [Deltaproteobacteria bacterium]
YHVGSKDEKPGLTGFAHLFEHLMFQGSPSSPGEFFKVMEEVGADLNGTTSFDRTNYFETVPSQYLPLALFLESDRMGWLLQTLDQGKLDNQRDVVRNERRQRYENPPYGEASMTLYAATFPDGHPYHHMPIGTHTDLQNAKLETVTDFFKTWYSPDNASVVIAGDFDPAVAKKLVEQYFGPIPKGPERTRPPAPDATLAKSVEIRQYDDVPEQKVWLGYQSPAAFAKGDAELDLLSYALSDGKDSRLVYRLVKEKGIAKDVIARQGSLALGSAFVIQATAAKGHTTDEVVAAIDEVIAELLTSKPPTAEEIDAARASFEVGYFNELQTIASKGDMLNRYNMMVGDPGYLQKDLQRYHDADPADVLAVAKEVLSKNRVALYISPKADEPPPPAPEPVAAPADDGKKKKKKEKKAKTESAPGEVN